MAAELDSPEPAHGPTLSDSTDLRLGCCTFRAFALTWAASCCCQTALGDLEEDQSPAVVCSAFCVTSHAGHNSSDPVARLCNKETTEEAFLVVQPPCGCSLQELGQPAGCVWEL